MKVPKASSLLRFAPSVGGSCSKRDGTRETEITRGCGWHRTRELLLVIGKEPRENLRPSERPEYVTGASQVSLSPTRGPKFGWISAHQEACVLVWLAPHTPTASTWSARGSPQPPGAGQPGGQRLAQGHSRVAELGQLRLPGS